MNDNLLQLKLLCDLTGVANHISQTKALFGEKWYGQVADGKLMVIHDRGVVQRRETVCHSIESAFARILEIEHG
jgi:hypothetical protein